MSLFTIFSGRPTTNPEMRQAKTGTEYISLDIAVPQYSPDGKENAMFVQCYFNKSLADRLLKAKVMKGTCLQIRGDLKANAFIYQQGEKAGQPGLNLNCYVENWEFCLSNRQNSGQDSNPGQNGNYQPNGNNQGGNYANGGGQNNHTPNGNPSGGAYAGNNGPNNRSAIGRNMNDGYSGGAPGGCAVHDGTVAQGQHKITAVIPDRFCSVHDILTGGIGTDLIKQDVTHSSQIQFLFHAGKIAVLFCRLTVRSDDQRLFPWQRFLVQMPKLTCAKQHVEEIAAMLGYSNSSNFYKAFREYYHQSPREFTK
ncbi:hypothetical protein B5G27_14060 [Lachnoclostridium sp. An76]|nr:helix-turn-helix domain-containing protein [Lachnoclostridium sp. An76]OUN32956.1 hypothetical protein B5G27_14060 [Lachnoclostridium sp. An76]